MRVIYVNLQTNGLCVRNINQMVAGRRSLPKHRFYIDWMRDNGVEIINFVTKSGTTLPLRLIRKITRFIPLRILEAKFVLKKNGLGDICSISDPDLIKEDDIVICYSFNGINQFENVKNIHAIKVVDMVHLYGDSQTANLIRDCGFGYYMYEVDLKKYSSLFKKNYEWFKGEYIIKPFGFENRFKNVKEFEKRKTMAVAMGTHTTCNLKEFMDEYGTNSYQPHRKMIRDNAYKYPNEIVSYISDFSDGVIPLKPNDSNLIKIKKKFHNYFALGQQKSYFSFDMVKTYNDYKMFICPEDINGSYGVGTLEGMACGCAMIGINIGIFEDMGMVAGRDYISYDGTMENLIKVIRYYQLQENQEELFRIATSGCEFVRSHYSREVVAHEYYEKLKSLVPVNNG